MKFSKLIYKISEEAAAEIFKDGAATGVSIRMALAKAIGENLFLHSSSMDVGLSERRVMGDKVYSMAAEKAAHQYALQLLKLGFFEQTVTQTGYVETITTTFPMLKIEGRNEINSGLQVQNRPAPDAG